MEEIKFRAWDKVSKKMVSNAYTIDAWGRCSASVEYFGDVDWHVMQYTGLKDKNGKEIYNGDILKHTSFEDSKPWEVTFERGCFVCEYQEPTDVEVIGNVWENPDLLNP